MPNVLILQSVLSQPILNENMKVFMTNFIFQGSWFGSSRKYDHRARSDLLKLIGNVLNYLSSDQQDNTYEGTSNRYTAIRISFSCH